MKKRLDEIEYKMWMIEMADFIRGDEKVKYEKLKEERRQILAEMAKEERK